MTSHIQPLAAEARPVRSRGHRGAGGSRHGGRGGWGSVFQLRRSANRGYCRSSLRRLALRSSAPPSCSRSASAYDLALATRLTTGSSQ